MTHSNNGAAPVRSMTGFAQVRKKTDLGDLSVSLRSVNHRGLDLHFHQSSEFSPFEGNMRAALKEKVGRGHLEIRVSLARADSNGAIGCNAEALNNYVAAFRSAAEALGLNYQPDLNVLLTLPGVMAGSTDARTLDDAFKEVLMAAFCECIDALNAAREREGTELRKALLTELDAIEQSTKAIANLRDEAIPHLQTRLREKLTELLAGAALSESRIAEEAAILADRSDVEEELTRLTVHSAELRRIVESGGAVGKPLDFLLQEMNRETNTTLSKSSGAGEPALKITNLALSVKANIERIREQALNLE